MSEKKSIAHEIPLTDRKLIRIVKQCRELPGFELFQYLDADGQRRPVHSEDVNNYLREHTGIELTAKDFRTWGGSTLAIHKLLSTPQPEEEKEVNKHVNEAIKFVASKLGNTPAVCRKYYIHPLVLEAYQDGTLLKMAAEVEKSNPGEGQQGEAVLALLRQTAGEAAS